MNCLLKAASVLIAIALCACAHEPPPDSAGILPAISLRAADADTWRAEYALPRPAAALRFTRNPDDSRARRWRVEEGFEIAHIDGADFLRRIDGGEFRSVSLEAPARYVQLPKDYAPFSPYSDGGLLIFSGQFHACAGPAECPDDAEWRFTVTPPPEVRLIVRGDVHDSAVTFTDGGDGMNIYAGRALPLETSHFIAVIDAGLPVHVRDALYDLLPPLMDLFTERLGALSAKPMLFASLDPNPPKGSQFSSQGGTLPNQIFIHLYGEGWREGAADNVTGFMPWFFAHEAGHLFQAVEGRPDAYSMEEAWIHEGGADAFAAFAIGKLGVAPPGYVEGRIKKALASCAKGLAALEGEALNASGAAGAFDNYYTCGLLIHIAIDAEVKAASTGERDLFDVWSLFLQRIQGGAEWNADVFLAAASESGATSSVNFARALAETPQADPEAFLRSGLSAAGVSVE